MKSVNANTHFYLFSFMITGLCMFVLGAFFDNEANLQKVKTMLIHKSALSTISVTKVTLMILMINMEYINYYVIDGTNHTFMALLSYAAIDTCFFCLLIMTYKSIRWIENNMLHEITTMQLEYQKQLYSKQSDTHKTWKVYQHDHKAILENAVRFIESGEVNEARRLLKQTDDHLTEILQQYQRYSNSLIIDIILNGLDEKCRQNGIEFTANCYVPEDIAISELEFSRIFNNIANNAFEACIKQDSEEHRWITFRTYVKNKRLVIYEQNSFNGVLRYEKDKLVTTKVDRKLHGLGMDSIENTVQRLDGMFMFKPDCDKKVFEILIKIPLK
ncbi:MAG: ATP-binding protein [bacterium]|nr:ATP-binding protein [bacterium]